jgi:hypothetical protein
VVAFFEDHTLGRHSCLEMGDVIVVSVELTIRTVIGEAIRRQSSAWGLGALVEQIPEGGIRPPLHGSEKPRVQARVLVPQDGAPVIIARKWRVADEAR